MEEPGACVEQRGACVLSGSQAAGVESLVHTVHAPIFFLMEGS